MLFFGTIALIFQSDLDFDIKFLNPDSVSRFPKFYQSRVKVPRLKIQRTKNT